MVYHLYILRLPHSHLLRDVKTSDLVAGTNYTSFSPLTASYTLDSSSVPWNTAARSIRFPENVHQKSHAKLVITV